MTRNAAKSVSKQGMVCGSSRKRVCRKVLSLCQLDQRAAVSTLQKALASLSSASTIMHAAAEAELQWEHVATPVPATACALLLHWCCTAAVTRPVGGVTRPVGGVPR